MTQPQASQQNPPAYTPPQQPPTYEDLLPPNHPPPSYDDATHSETSPLLVGPPPGYGTYAEVDAQSTSSSTVASDVEEETSVAEYVGHAVVVFMFFAVVYGLWSIASDPPDFLGGFPP